MSGSSASTWGSLALLIERARRAAEQIEQAELEATGKGSKSKGELEILSDALRAQPARSRELRTSVQLLREALERAKLSALNAGLEGARLGDPVGRALVDLAQDLREQLMRAAGALDEHAAMLAELERERDRIADSIELARASLAAGSEALSRTSPLKRELGNALSEMELHVIQGMGADPGTARLLTAAADQARELRESLVGLVARGADGAARELVAGLEQLLVEGPDRKP